MVKAILIHGNGGCTLQDMWWPSVTTELEKLGITVVSKNFPDSQIARAKYWLPFIKELGADKQTIIIGHSSGAVAAMRYSENNKILGSVLIAGYHSDLDDATEKESGYFDKPWEWEKIKNNQQWIIQFNSTDDPYIPIDEARLVNEKLGSDYTEYTDKGHFMNQTDFPELIEAVKKKL